MAATLADAGPGDMWYWCEKHKTYWMAMNYKAARLVTGRNPEHCGRHYATSYVGVTADDVIAHAQALGHEINISD